MLRAHCRACLLAELGRARTIPPLHQQFTFIAAKQLNRCLEGSSLPRLTPLQVRYIAKSDVAQAQGSWFRSSAGATTIERRRVRRSCCG